MEEIENNNNENSNNDHSSQNITPNITVEQNSNSATTSSTLSNEKLSDANFKQESAFDFTSLVPYVVILFVFYFLVLKPQEKSRKEQKEKCESVKKGEKVLLNSGIHAKVSKAVDNSSTIEVEIAEKVFVTIERSAIVEILSRKTEKPAKTEKTDKPQKS